MLTSVLQKSCPQPKAPDPRQGVATEVDGGPPAVENRQMRTWVTTLLGGALLYAALIEGYFRQSHASMALRYGLAAFNALAIAAYLGLAGREGPAHENDKAPPRAQT